ncbi:MAG: SDR family oxidoreductase [Nitrospiraceae bacterium]|nr:MAG: SDR family oxidoreductase [Nitrospiraceae bacterium]
MLKPSKMLVFGATSAIAYETIKLFAKDGTSFYLCSRKEDELKRLADDLIVRGAKEVRFATFNALDVNSVTEAVNDCLIKFPDLDGLFIAHGFLPDQKVCETSIDSMRQVIDINFTSAATILTIVANYFEKRGTGTIIAVSSPGGDRGRQSNYVYGSAKGALTVFLSGLRQRLSRAGVSVITIKPGFVDTPMTVDFKKGILFVGPEVIARGIYKAVLKGKSEVYLPAYWRFIMMIIKHVPEMIFKKIKL